MSVTLAIRQLMLLMITIIFTHGTISTNTILVLARKEQKQSMVVLGAQVSLLDGPMHLDLMIQMRFVHSQ